MGRRGQHGFTRLSEKKASPLIVLIQPSIKPTNQKKWSATSSNPKSAEAPKQLPSGMKLLRTPKPALKLLSSPTKEEGPVLPNAHWRRQTSADKSWKRRWRALPGVVVRRINGHSLRVLSKKSHAAVAGTACKVQFIVRLCARGCELR